MGESLIIDAIYSASVALIDAGYAAAESLGAVAVGPASIGILIDAAFAAAAFGVALVAGKYFASWIKLKLGL